MIRKLVQRNIAANKGRLALMLLSVVLGVSFVSGSFLLADSLREIFGGISEQAFAGVDAQVRAAASDLESGEADTRFSDDIFDSVAAIPEVGYAEGGLFIFEEIFTIDEEGEPRRIQGPPVLTSSWAGPSPVSSFNLVEGRAPVGNEIAIDVSQADNGDLEVGDLTDVGFPGGDIEEFEIVGIVTFGEAAAGAYFNLFDLETLQRLMGIEGQVDAIALSAADGVSNSELISAVEEAIGFDPAFEVVTGETLIAEQNADFGQFIDIIGNVLLGFAIAVLFVSVFIIYNTFAILISQRIRQFGLLRSIGATGRQLTSMVLIEALIIGVVASILGLFGGIGIAWLLKLLFSSGGGAFPDGPIVFRPRTVIVVFTLGIFVTLFSALMPAFIAQRIPALAALRDGGASLTEGKKGRRTLYGSVVFIAGTVLLLLGLFGSAGTANRLTLLGFGAALLFIGVAMLSVLFAGRAARLIGGPVELTRGLRGRLARDNASRNPQRTAATATALMIGLALVTGVLVLAQSIKATFDKILDETVAADLFIYEENQQLPFAGTAVDQLADAPGISAVAGVADLRALVGGEVSGVTGFDVATGDSVLNIKLIDGTMDLGESDVLLFSDEADDLGLGIGDTVSVVFEDEFSDTFTIAGIFDDKTLMANNWVFDRSVTAAHSNTNTVGFIGATFDADADPATAEEAANTAVANFPQLIVQNNADFKQTQNDQINQILIIIFALLGLCIVVAFVGIVNTMVLSILERTREIGLLRAVGTSRKQLKSMVRWEAVIVGVFGALMGVVLGLVIGYAAVTAIPDSFVSEVSIPWVTAVVFTAVGGLIGMIAAVIPARRAANMNVLEAISHE